MKKNFKKLCLVLSICMFAAILTPLANLSAEPSQQPAAAIGTNFWFLASWSGETPYKTGVNFETAYTNGEDIWNPVFIDEIQPYSFLRFMDWGATNNSAVTSWSQRRQPTSFTNKDIETFKGIDGGLAYEWMIDLANRTNKDIWICIPHKADDNYISELAKLIKQRLNTNLKCYVEYSNETWNSGFGQYQYCVDKGVSLKLPGDEKPYQGEAYSIYRSLQAFNLFQDVFGQDMKSRIVKVCSIGGLLNWFDASYRDVAYDYKLNPKRQFADMMCIAPYVGAEIIGSSPNAAADFIKGIDTVYESTILPAVELAKKYGIRLGTYEGGQHLRTDADVFSKNPQIYDCYQYMLEKFCPKLEIFTHYAHCGNPSSEGAWGAKFKTGQPISEAHRYRALVNFIADHPVHNQPAQSAALKAPKISKKYITDRTTSIEGIYTGNTDIILKAGGKTYKTVPDAFGDFKFKKLNFSSLKNGSSLVFSATVTKGTDTSASPAKTFKLVKLPKDIKLSSKKLKRTTKFISGRTTASANIKILVKGKKYKDFKAGKNGKFKVKVNFKKFKKNTYVKIYSYKKIGKDQLKTKVFTLRLK